MPHNNRMSTSAALKTSDIWSKTIGHNPYAAAGEKQEESNSAADAAKAKGLLELARHQNIAGDTSSRDDFARKMFLGLKTGKKRRDGALVADDGDAKLLEILGQDSSSSEDEYVASTRIRTQPKGSTEGPSDESEESDNDSTRRRRKRKEKKKRRRKHRNYEASSSSDDEEEERRKRKRRRKEVRRKRREGCNSSSEEDEEIRKRICNRKEKRQKRHESRQESSREER